MNNIEHNHSLRRFQTRWLTQNNNGGGVFFLVFFFQGVVKRVSFFLSFFLSLFTKNAQRSVRFRRKKIKEFPAWTCHPIAITDKIWLWYSNHNCVLLHHIYFPFQNWTMPMKKTFCSSIVVIAQGQWNGRNICINSTWNCQNEKENWGKYIFFCNLLKLYWVHCQITNHKIFEKFKC